MYSPNPTPTPRHPNEHRQQSDPSEYALRAIQALHDASDPCDLLVALFRANRAFGVRASACVHLVPDPEHAPQVLLLLACDAELAWVHSHRGSWLEHPWLRHARDHAEAVVASSLEAPQPAITDRSTDSESLSALDTILIIPTHSGGGTGRFGALIIDTACEQASAAMPPDSLRLLAHSLASELHEWWLRRTRAELQGSSRLRSDDLRLLGYERQGLSTKEIARLVGVSVSALDSRFQRINAKLGTSHRRHAALRAAIHGLL